jgi:Mg/Co/Ni transporter MgtE
MCFDALLDGDANEQSTVELLRGELASATANGLVAATIVVAALVTQGTAPGLVAAMAGGAFVLAILLHQFVLLAGARLVRRRTTVSTGASSTARSGLRE